MSGYYATRDLIAWHELSEHDLHWFGRLVRLAKARHVYLKRPDSSASDPAFRIKRGGKTLFAAATLREVEAELRRMPPL